MIARTRPPNHAPGIWNTDQVTRSRVRRLFSCEGAALEATFRLVNQSMSVMSCNGRHSDQKLVNQSKFVISCNVRHGDQLCVCVCV